MDNCIYWIWLSLCFAYGSEKPLQLVENFDAEYIYNHRKDILKSIDYLTDKNKKRIMDTPLKKAESILKRCQELNISVITYDDDNYPQKLKHIYGAPLVIYVKGDISYINHTLNITVVGTRKATDYGKSVTGNMSYVLASAGATIISGCAEGVDEYSHRGALKARGRTVGVLACGHDINYPAKNYNLKKAIIERGGALISEVPPGSGVIRGYFPVRNRIMAGLSDGVLVTEAPIRSGSLITARLANDMDRDVFCVPPFNLYDNKCLGVVSLMRDGAKAVFEAKDILDEYLVKYEGRIDWNRVTEFVDDDVDDLIVASESSYKVSKNKESKKAKKKPLPPENLTEKQKKLYGVLGFEPMHVDDLTQKISWPAYEVLAVLTELELTGIVIAHSGRRYSLNDE